MKQTDNTKQPNSIKLYDRLKARGLTLRLLSRVSGVAYSTVYNLFTGKRSVHDASAETVRKLSVALDMTMDALYDALENTNSQPAAPIRNFTLMWRDEPAADLMISGGKVFLERHTTNPAKQLFYADQISLFTLGEILRTRCWDEHRTDIRNLLHMIGLTEYDPYAIVSRTHGLMAQDPIWFRFEGEHLTYKEIRRLNIVTENNATENNNADDHNQ